MESIFNLINVIPMPVWISMIIFPKARFTQKMVLSPWLFIGMSGVYATLLIASIVSSGATLDFTMTGIQQGFSQDLGLLAGWMHYLTFDLFVGVWIFRDAKYWQMRIEVYLLLTLFVGPIGLALYLLMRKRQEKSLMLNQRIVN